MALDNGAVDERRIHGQAVARGADGDVPTPETPEPSPNKALRPTPTGAIMCRRGRTLSLGHRGRIACSDSSSVAPVVAESHRSALSTSTRPDTPLRASRAGQSPRLAYAGGRRPRGVFLPGPARPPREREFVG